MLELNFTPFPEIETERLLLRSYRKEDAQEIFEVRNDEEVMRYIDRPRPKSIDEIYTLLDTIEKGVAENRLLGWVVTLKNTGEMAGFASFHKIYPEHYRAEVGYQFLRKHWRKGYGDETLKAVLHFGFNTLRLHSVEANVNPLNAGSVRLLEKNNFVREAYFKENFFYDGKFLDTAIYSLITPLKK